MKTTWNVLHRPIMLIIILIISSVLYGCDSAQDVEDLRNDMSIISITSSSSYIGQTSTYNVVVSYKLGKCFDQGVVNIGFNTEAPGCYLYSDQEQIVSRGSGTLIFTDLSAIPVDWGTAGKFSVIAMLSSYPDRNKIFRSIHDAPLAATLSAESLLVGGVFSEESPEAIINPIYYESNVYDPRLSEIEQKNIFSPMQKSEPTGTIAPRSVCVDQ